MINWIKKKLGIIYIEELLHKLHNENAKTNESISNFISNSTNGILQLENRTKELHLNEELEIDLPLLQDFQINGDLSFYAINPELLSLEYISVSKEKSNNGLIVKS